jgi:hypothetical protein
MAVTEATGVRVGPHREMRRGCRRGCDASAAADQPILPLHGTGVSIEDAPSLHRGVKRGGSSSSPRWLRGGTEDAPEVVSITPR